MLAHQQAPYLNTSDLNRKPIKPMDDACWQTQRRVPLEIQQPQVGKIAIPELSEKEIQRTIVAQPASYHKVEWNEFPEQPQHEITAAPRTKTQEWVPVNNELNELQRSIYKPARMSAVWPPPQEELIKEDHSPLSIKANDDTAWIQQDSNEVQKQAVWGKTSRINRVWPPPENESTLSSFGPQHMPVVQWPPPEAEAHEREQVEVLQKHIPTKKMERQWPPPPPQYQVVESSGEIETQYNPAEAVDQQHAVDQQQQVIRTVIRSQ
uniref:ZM domain-containing protein n=1 Tax=Caenorhabditis tropicalis TaxID=1561998 RepID=A0A1I7V373_9PELO